MTAAVKIAPTPKKQTVRQAGLVNVESIIAAPYNPPGRVALAALAQLQASMDAVGLLYPVLIDEGRNLIDGHRRLACAKLLGWDVIAALCIPSDQISRDAAYASVNVTARKMSGNDALRVWLANPLAVGRKHAVGFERMREELGADLISRACREGFSHRLYETARRLSRYLSQDSADFVRRAFAWLMEHATVGQVMKAMEAGHPPRVFLNAIRRDRGVTLKLAVTED